MLIVTGFKKKLREKHNLINRHIEESVTDRQTDVQTNRQTDKQTDSIVEKHNLINKTQKNQ